MASFQLGSESLILSVYNLDFKVDISGFIHTWRSNLAYKQLWWSCLICFQTFFPKLFANFADEYLLNNPLFFCFLYAPPNNIIWYLTVSIWLNLIIGIQWTFIFDSVDSWGAVVPSIIAVLRFLTSENTFHLEACQRAPVFCTLKGSCTVMVLSLHEALLDLSISHCELWTPHFPLATSCSSSIMWGRTAFQMSFQTKEVWILKNIIFPRKYFEPQTHIICMDIRKDLIMMVFLILLSYSI